MFVLWILIWQAPFGYDNTDRLGSKKISDGRREPEIWTLTTVVTHGIILRSDLLKTCERFKFNWHELPHLAQESGPFYLLTLTTT